MATCPNCYTNVDETITCDNCGKEFCNHCHTETNASGEYSEGYFYQDYNCPKCYATYSYNNIP
ncbi:MAG: hypothetical protein HQK84_04260 [Nitrospinae bacterium]|nr:hypothetical protein [Nitrospinota bacterium]